MTGQINQPTPSTVQVGAVSVAPVPVPNEFPIETVVSGLFGLSLLYCKAAGARVFSLLSSSPHVVVRPL